MSVTHQVKPGECLASLAHAYGFGDFRAIWGHSENAELRQKRPDPHALVPGDAVVIPDKEERVEACATGRRHLLRLRRPRAWLRIVLKDADGTPLADRKYWLVLGPAGVWGRSDAKGLVEQKIPPDAREAELVVWLDEELPDGEVLGVRLRLGHLAPLETAAGAQARLASLGYACAGDPEGEPGPATREAIQAFQKDRGLKETGAPDAPTLERLRSAYEGG